jgi:hypothetical protein
MTPEDIRKVLKLQRNLTKLPKQYGFDSMDEFISVIYALRGEHPAANLPLPKRRKRGKLTEKKRKQIETLLTQGKAVSYICRKVRLSAPSVYKVKNNLPLGKTVKKTNKETNVSN